MTFTTGYNCCLLPDITVVLLPDITVVLLPDITVVLLPDITVVTNRTERKNPKKGQKQECNFIRFP